MMAASSAALTPCRCRWTSRGRSIARRECGERLGGPQRKESCEDLGAGRVQPPAAPPPCLSDQNGHGSASCGGRYHDPDHVNHFGGGGQDRPSESHRERSAQDHEHGQAEIAAAAAVGVRPVRD
jgi:hypothetical protein